MQELSKNKHEKNLKLSIIIPVYNTEKYVGECLDSCVDQDIPKNEYEIICVDDGSTDGSRKVLATYSEKYSNIHVYKQKNQGVSAARNGGISVAQGKYIWFVDSDDYIAVNCLKILLGAMEQYNAETCMFSYESVPEVRIFDSPAQIQINSMGMLNKRRTSNNVFNIIFLRKTLIENNIFFPTNKSYGEDTFFSFMYSLYADASKILRIGGVFYYYRQRSGSAMHTKSVVATEKYVQSMKFMAMEYNEILDEGRLPKNIVEEVQNRVKLAVSAAMFSAASDKQYDNNKLIAEFKEQGLYPYKLYWGSLKPNTSFKHTVIEWIKFLFPFESYYKLFTYIIRKIH